MINGESANAQDARVEELWRRLDGTARGYLDLAGLKKGLRKMDHRMWRQLEGLYSLAASQS
jgi:solute carrier family 25 phosphate transporter 23/24/25/41